MYKLIFASAVKYFGYKMIINNETIDHIEVYDETGRLVATISDSEVIERTNCTVKLCDTDKMFEQQKGIE